jgi:hypothetical protein
LPRGIIASNTRSAPRLSPVARASERGGSGGLRGRLELERLAFGERPVLLDRRVDTQAVVGVRVDGAQDVGV